MIGYYYLHTNGDLIFKKFQPEDDSDFVRKIWTIDTTNRLDAWRVAAEAAALGARRERVLELQKKWGLTNEDAEHLAGVVGLRFFMDGDQWCAAAADFECMAEEPAGFGDDCLIALGEYLKQTGGRLPDPVTA